MGADSVLGAASIRMAGSRDDWKLLIAVSMRVLVLLKLFCCEPRQRKYTFGGVEFPLVRFRLALLCATPRTLVERML